MDHLDQTQTIAELELALDDLLVGLETNNQREIKTAGADISSLVVKIENIANSLVDKHISKRFSDKFPTLLKMITVMQAKIAVSAAN